MYEAWIHNIPKMWKERGIKIPEGSTVEDLIIVPDNAQYYAAMGAIEFAFEEGEHLISQAKFLGRDELKYYMDVTRHKKKQGSGGLSKNEEELQRFLKEYTPPTFKAAQFKKQEEVNAFLGIDSGSTSTKAVLINEEGEVLQKAYKLSDGNPIQDTQECLKDLKNYVEGYEAKLNILGVGTTGYAKDVLAEVIGADTALVETVAHTMASKHYYPEVNVICDVGGQDIKIIMLQNGRVSDFRLNTQCSAGNGYFLQSTASALGYKVTDYAEVAFKAQRMPSFGYGCAVFMQSDIVNFQKEGWTPEEIMAGLADVLPKNIWLYVSKIPNLTSLGTTFVLQGGTQYNLAAVKAQVDFIQERFISKGVRATIHVHKHCGEAGAIGCAIEASRMYKNGHQTSFIGLEQLEQVSYIKTSDERTRCLSCKNHCSRTFIDVKVKNAEPLPFQSKLPLLEGHKRIITGFSCDRGTVESMEDVKSVSHSMAGVMKKNPNLVAEMAQKAFKPVRVSPAIPKSWKSTFSFGNRVDKRREKRQSIRLGIPRVLNMYNLSPFFMGYFQSLGLLSKNILFSPMTNEKLYKDGAKRGSIDPCFPSKIAIPHVHHLLEMHKKRPMEAIFFPMIFSFPSYLKGTSAPMACPTVCSTPEAAKAAFTKEQDVFKESGTEMLTPLLEMHNAPLLANQLFDSLAPLLNLSKDENTLAVEQGLKALADYDAYFRKRGREILEQLEKENRIGFVILARPYHNDEGLNHEIILKIQRLGYPIFSLDSLPLDPDILQDVFASDLESKRIDHPLEIKDVWKTSFSENTSRKVWGTKFAARHKHLVALELSSFKCGHDAPPYAVIERILSSSKTPFFTFRDLDENDPGGAIKIRLETIHYFLKLEIEKLRGESSHPKLEMAELLGDCGDTAPKLCSMPEAQRHKTRTVV